ncbi:MAG: hypothetical protein V2A66_07905 [Pseudomonadota bacterium]
MATRDTTGTAGGTPRKMSEIMIVTKNELGALSRITTPLAKNHINISCFTGYEWGGEAAFRLVTDNNKKACDVLRTAGYNVQENPVVLWNTENKPGHLLGATTALAEANINTFCSYSTTSAGAPTCVVAFNTSDTDRTIDVLKRVRF